MFSYNITFTIFKFLITFALKTSIIYIAASLITLALKKYSSILRRTLWAMVIFSFVLMLLQPFFPSLWKISVDPLRVNSEKLDFFSPVSHEASAQIENINNADETLQYSILASLFNSLRSWSVLLLFLWLGGMLIYGGYFLKRCHFTKKIKKNALIADHELNDLLKNSAKKIGIRNPITLKITNCLNTACTLGIKHPAVFLPTESKAWSAASIRMVLYHELAHIKGKDCLLELITQGLCVVFWFHPFVWMTARKYRIEREKACDEIVVNKGIRPSDYANQLLRIVSSIKNRSILFPENAVLFQKNGIRSRLLAILNPKITKISKTMKRIIILSLFIFFIMLSVISLHFGIPEKPLSRDALTYWANVPDRNTSAAFLLEKDISFWGFSTAMHAMQQKSSSGSRRYYFNQGEIDAVGRRLFDAANIREALEVFQFNAQIFPDIWQVYNSLGNAYQAKGDLKTAISYYEKMLGLNVPNELKILRHIAELKKNIQ
jgi:beta-lactamase regulating signal transducer with metallopeptidase domain